VVDGVSAFENGKSIVEPEATLAVMKSPVATAS